MRIFVWANCQGGAFAKFLPLLVRSTNSFEIIHIENYKAMAGSISKGELVRLANWADVFIFQPIGPGHGFFSTVEGEDNIRSNVRKSCSQISIPYVYNSGLWPFYLEDAGTQNGIILDQYIDDGASLEDSLHVYDSGALDCRFEERIAASLEMFRQREIGYKIDIKLYDFMRRWIRERSLMLSQSHPNTTCFAELAASVFEMMLGKTLPRNLIDTTKLGRNFVDLPGRYPVDQYCADNLKKVFPVGVEDGAAEFYKSVINIHYQRKKEDAHK